MRLGLLKTIFLSLVVTINLNLVSSESLAQAPTRISKTNQYIIRYLAEERENAQNNNEQKVEIFNTLLERRRDYCVDDTECDEIDVFGPFLCVTDYNDIRRMSLITHLATTIKSESAAIKILEMTSACSEQSPTAKLWPLLKLAGQTSEKGWAKFDNIILKRISENRGISSPHALLEKAMKEAIDEVTRSKPINIAYLAALYSNYLTWELDAKSSRLKSNENFDELVLSISKMVFLMGMNSMFIDFVSKNSLIFKEKNIKLKSAITSTQCGYLRVSGKKEICLQRISELKSDKLYPESGDLRIEIIKALLESSDGKIDEAINSLNKILNQMPQNAKKTAEPRILAMLALINLENGRVDDASVLLKKIKNRPLPDNAGWTDIFYPLIIELRVLIRKKDYAKAMEIIAELEDKLIQNYLGPTELQFWVSYYKLYLSIIGGSKKKIEEIYKKGRGVAVSLPDYRHFERMISHLYASYNDRELNFTGGEFDKDLGSNHPYINELKILIREVQTLQNK
jgi:tetratricopeptide (TPR) repeat protein